MRKAFWGVLLALSLLGTPAFSQYGGPPSMGRRPARSERRTAPTSATGQHRATRHPRWLRPRTLTGPSAKITGNVLTVGRRSTSPGKPTRSSNSGSPCRTSRHRPADYKPQQKDSVRVIYEPKTIDGKDVRWATKVIY